MKKGGSFNFETCFAVSLLVFGVYLFTMNVGFVFPSLARDKTS